MNSQIPPQAAGAKASNTITRRSFLKRAAGTILLFGVGLQMQQAVAGHTVPGTRYGRWCLYPQNNIYYYCYFQAVTNLDPNDTGVVPCVGTEEKTIGIGGGPLQDCVHVEGPKQCLGQFPGLKKEKIGNNKNHWCVW